MANTHVGLLGFLSLYLMLTCRPRLVEGLRTRAQYLGAPRPLVSPHADTPTIKIHHGRDHATDLVSNYWAKQPKSELGVKKRGRASTSAKPEPEPRPAKTPRVFTTRNGSAANPTKARQESVEDLPGPDWQSTHVDSFDKYEDVADWEDLVASVDTIEKGSNNELLVYLTM